MLNIYKLIEHVVQDLVPLNEYSQGMLNRLMDKFKEEADDKNIEISDKLLSKYIQKFDSAKQALPADQRDIEKWTLQRLMKFASQTTEEDDEEWDPGLDEVYESEDGQITVWNGNTEDRCIRFAKDEAPWCIARGMFKTYHLSRDRGFPTFYLLRNRKLPDTDNLSFVALQVRDKSTQGESREYVFTNRDNYPHESNPMSWEQFTSQVPWVEKEIPNAKEVLKYQPLSPSDKASVESNNSKLTAKQFSQLPLDRKKNYLVARKGKEQVGDMDNATFLIKYIAPFNVLAKYVAIDPQLVGQFAKLQAIDAFSKSEQRSIIANLQDYDVDPEELWQDRLPWRAKQLITATNHWRTSRIGNTVRIFLSDNDNAISRVEQTSTNEKPGITLGYVTEHEEHPNVKINKNTAKYLVGMPVHLITPEFIVQLSGISPEVDKYFGEALTKLATKDLKEDEKRKVYKVEKDGVTYYVMPKAGKGIKFENGQIELMSIEEVEELTSDETKVETVEEAKAAFVRAMSGPMSIRTDLSLESFARIINAVPYLDRPQSTESSYEGVPLVSERNGVPIIFVKQSKNSLRVNLKYGGYRNESWKEPEGYGNLTIPMWKEYFKMIQEIGGEQAKYSPRDLTNLYNNVQGDNSYDSLKAFVQADPPLNDETKQKYKLDIVDDDPALLDLESPEDSFKVRISGTMSRVSQAAYRRSVGTSPQRPARNTQPAETGREEAADAFEDWQPTTTGDAIEHYVTNTVGVQFATLPTRVKERLSMGCKIIPLEDRERGQVSRDRVLGNRGQVITTARLAGPHSAMYIIELTSGNKIISVAIHPGNVYGIISDRGFLRINSMNQFLDVLDRYGLREDYQAVLDEAKTLKVKSIVKEAVLEYLKKK